MAIGLLQFSGENAEGWVGAVYGAAFQRAPDQAGFALLDQLAAHHRLPILPHADRVPLLGRGLHRRPAAAEPAAAADVEEARRPRHLLTIGTLAGLDEQCPHG